MVCDALQAGGAARTARENQNFMKHLQQGVQGKHDFEISLIDGIDFLESFLMHHDADRKIKTY